MGCSGCSSGGSCGTSGSSSSSACGTCHTKLPVFNWLSDVHDPKQDIVEVTFKNGRKEFFRNKDKLQLRASDVVTVEGNPGYDIGIVSMAGALIRLQLRKKGVDKNSDEIKKVYRKSNQQDLDKWHIARGREKDTMYRTRILASGIGLKMKITDVEFQGDNGKATFYYTAEERVDFRELIKLMAQEFKIRIEMRQIGARQESARLGGIGSCGRELCCSTWLTDFRSVNTSAARYQQLSLNPQKLAGQCGKLKCCLNFELESYIDVLKDAPPQTALKLKNKRAQFQKMDIFGGKILYCIMEEFKTTWVELSIDKVREVQALNEKGIYPETLEDFEIPKEIEAKVEFENVVGQDSLNRFDHSQRGRKSNGNKKRNDNNSKSKGRVKTNSNKSKEQTVKKGNSNRNTILAEREKKRAEMQKARVGTKSNSNKPSNGDRKNTGPKRNPRSGKPKQNAKPSNSENNRLVNKGNPGRRKKPIPKPKDGGMEAFVKQQKEMAKNEGKSKDGKSSSEKGPHHRRKQKFRKKPNSNNDRSKSDDK